MDDGNPGVLAPLRRSRYERDRVASSEVWTGGRAGSSPAVLKDGAGVLATRSAGTARVGCVLMSGDAGGDDTVAWGAVAEVSAQ